MAQVLAAENNQKRVVLKPSATPKSMDGQRARNSKQSVANACNPTTRKRKAPPPPITESSILTNPVSAHSPQTLPSLTQLENSIFAPLTQITSFPPPPPTSSSATAAATAALPESTYLSALLFFNIFFDISLAPILEAKFSIPETEHPNNNFLTKMHVALFRFQILSQLSQYLLSNPSLNSAEGLYSSFVQIAESQGIVFT